MIFVYFRGLATQAITISALKEKWILLVNDHAKERNTKLKLRGFLLAKLTKWWAVLNLGLSGQIRAGFLSLLAWDMIIGKLLARYSYYVLFLR
jgi:hypothetical protein